MATFEVPVIRIKAIEPIEGADAIELAVIGDFRSVVRKGQYRAGDLAVYIPEQSILPPALIAALGMEGRLAGSEHNRVKAVKLRGVLSQGILWPVDSGEDCGGPFTSVPDGVPHTDDGIGDTMLIVSEGDNVAAEFGITKYNPPVPVHLSGEVYNAGRELTVAYDIENFKKYPDVLKEGEEVTFTEKLHGTFCGVGVLPRKDHNDKHYKREFVVFSKGLGADGLCFKDVSINQDNAYINALTKLGIFDKLRDLRDMMEDEHGFDKPLFLLGEVLGQGIQDLTYGSELTFRLFDVVAGYRGDQHYFDDEEKQLVANQLGIPRVPVLYRGPFSREVMYQYTDGMETFSGKEVHMREGIVVTPTVERMDLSIGRVILKSVSEKYLTRKNKNATEYQ